MSDFSKTDRIVSGTPAKVSGLAAGTLVTIYVFLVELHIWPPIALVAAGIIVFPWTFFPKIIRESVGFGAFHRMATLLNLSISDKDFHWKTPIPPAYEWMFGVLPVPVSVLRFWGWQAVAALGTAALVFTMAPSEYHLVATLLWTVSCLFSLVVQMAYWAFSNASLHCWRMPRSKFDRFARPTSQISKEAIEAVWRRVCEEGLGR